MNSIWAGLQLRRRLSPARVRSRERGSGSVLAVGLLGATMAATAAFVPVLVGLSVSAQVQGAADAAALAAADTVSGALTGVPCEAATRTANVNGASIATCSLNGLIASVTVSREFVGITIEARSRAGPPAGAPIGASTGPPIGPPRPDGG
jgi:secretion/DNA translocation related TadE-like protein